MAVDAYVKFGESPDRGGPDGNSPLPDIEGDSSDSQHWYWCELRECGFDMSAPEENEQDGDDSGGDSQSDSQGESDEDASTNKTSFAPVTLRKRVDWASTELFRRCCQASMATMPNHDPEDGTGIIDQVTVEICRPAKSADGKSDKIPCVKVRYYGVKVTKYAISMSGPEPTETITFEFDEVDFTYLQTDPYTNVVINDPGAATDKLKNHHKKGKGHHDSEGSGGGGSGSGGDSDGSGGTGGGNSGNPASPSLPALLPGLLPGLAPSGIGTVAFPGGTWPASGPPGTES